MTITPPRAVHNIPPIPEPDLVERLAHWLLRQGSSLLASCYRQDIEAHVEFCSRCQWIDLDNCDERSFRCSVGRKLFERWFDAGIQFANFHRRSAK